MTNPAPPAPWGQGAQPPQPPPPSGWQAQQPAPSAWQPQAQQGPPPGWGQAPQGAPQQAPPPGWGQAQQGAPQQGPPPGWVQPQQGWVQPPGGMWVQKSSVTGLAKLGAAILIVFSLLWILVGALLLLVGREFVINNYTGNFGDITPAQVGAAVGIIGVVILAIGIAHLLSGIFAWRGNGFWRVIGVLIGLIFGLFWALGAVGSLRTTGSGSGFGVGLAIGVGYLYTAVVFIFAYRRTR